MLGVELQTTSVVRASNPCESEGEAPTGEGVEPASAGISASPGTGIEMRVSENTLGYASSSEMDSSASSSSGT